MTFFRGRCCAENHRMIWKILRASAPRRNPARQIRRRFDETTIAALLDIARSDWLIEAIRAEEATICSVDQTRLQAVADALRGR